MRRIKLARVLEKLSDVLPRRHPLHSSAGLSVQPFFVLGSGRNGSTMLNRMLNQLDGIFLPSEQYFLGNSIIKYKLYNFLIWRDLVKIISGELLPATGSHTWDFDGNEVISELFLQEDKSLQAIIDTIYRSYAEKFGHCKIWGDTTPLNTRYLPEVYSLFPGARFIFLLRDGRDVVASYHAAGEAYLGHLATPEEATRHWNHAINRYEWLSKRTEVMLLRYEHLVQKPEEALRELCTFLETEYDEKALNFHQSAAISKMYREPQHENIFKPLSTASIGKWQRSFSASDPVFAAMEHNLKKFGYS